MSKDIVKALVTKKFSEAKDLVFKSLYAKAALAMDDARLGVASSVFNSPSDETDEVTEEVEEEVEEVEEVDESNMKELDTERQLKGGYFTDAKSRKAHVDKFYARKAKEKASRSPSEIEKDAKTDAYRAAHTKKTGKRLGRID